MEFIFSVAVAALVTVIMIILGFLIAFVGTRTMYAANNWLPKRIDGLPRVLVSMMFAFVSMNLFARFLGFLAQEATAE